MPPLAHAVEMMLVVLGITYVVTGSKAGYPLRFVGCLILKKLRLKFLWNLLQCPPCNAWWAGLAVSYALWGGEYWALINFAFASCGVVAVLNIWLGGLLAANEDFDKIFDSLQTAKKES